MRNGYRGKGVGLVVGLAVLATSALAAPLAGADQIAYSCGDDLCLIDPDNRSDNRFLTETDGAVATERSPVWSPDGSLIAYKGFYSSFGSWDVWTLDPTESANDVVATNISDSPDRSVESRPAWSPDGTRLAYAERYSSNAPPNLESEVYVSPSDGSADPVAVGSTSNKSELTPAWSPNGASLVFSREGLLWKWPSNGSASPAVLPNSAGYEPAFSPDGSRIATVTFSSPEHVRVTKADGSGFVELPVPADLSSSVDWSPDSTQVVYSADEEPIDRIRVAPADGSASGHAIDMPDGWGVPYHASLSPDGTRVAFDAISPGGYRQILVAPADGSSPAVPVTTVLSENQEPDWKPCEGCAPPAGPSTPGGGGGAGTGSGGAAAGGNGQATKTPTKVRLVYLRAATAWTHTTLVFINCDAEGGHPDPKYCKGDGIARASVPARTLHRPWARPKAKQAIVFAKGSVNVPEGKSKPLKMKVTAAGRKLLSTGKAVKVTLSVKVTRPTGKAQTFKRTIKVKAPPGKAK